MLKLPKSSAAAGAAGAAGGVAGAAVSAARASEEIMKRPIAAGKIRCRGFIVPQTHHRAIPSSNKKCNFMQIISNRSHGMPGKSLFHIVHRMFPVEFGLHAQQHAPEQTSPEIPGKHEKWTAPLFTARGQSPWSEQVGPDPNGFLRFPYRLSSHGAGRWREKRLAGQATVHGPPCSQEPTSKPHAESKASEVSAKT